MKKRILVVEDSAFDRELLMRALSRKGHFEVLEVSSGDECLYLLEKESVDLILMDVMMPGTFGNQILSKLREKYNQIQLPIIMVTSKAETADIIHSLHSGANDYITKPVNFEIALSRINIHLTLSQLSKDMSKYREMEALDAMITTYNHEINNPLTIALSTVNGPTFKDEKSIERLRNALLRIAEIVKKIREVTNKREVEFGDYIGKTKMIKIN